ncbi:MAG: hypothetical protein WB762_29550 [Candidatus Sulfotelmatobacter sp.]
MRFDSLLDLVKRETELTRRTIWPTAPSVGSPRGKYRARCGSIFVPWSCGSLEKPSWEDLKIYEKDSTLIHIVPGKTNELDLRLIRAR